MPTLSGLRRKGVTPDAIRNFCNRIGVAKMNSVVDIALLEHFIREDLNKKAMRVMAVLKPLKVIIDNYPEDKTEELDAENNPEDPKSGTRKIPFSRVIYIEQDDFREDPPKKFFRLAPGREIRLKHAYYITCNDVVKNDRGEVIELHCSYDPESRGGGTADGRKVKGTLHWVSASHCLRAQIRLYEHLFTKENPGDFKEDINPNSVQVLNDCLVEPSLSSAKPGLNYQFLRQGYFCLDSEEGGGNNLVFNRTISLRDSWAKIEKKS
jgi:glutaminyl-tRNA synthetase